MERTIPTKLDGRLVEALDRLVERGMYTSRSEAIRSAVRELVTRHYVSLQEFYGTIAKIASELIVQRFGDRVSDVILYGSVAKGKADEESDIDLLILTEEGEDSQQFRRIDEKILGLTYAIDLAAGVVTTPLLMSKRRFMKLVEEGYTFARDVLESGLQLYGSTLTKCRKFKPT